jgi:very-short-patch-repair endonuclease
MAIDVVKSRKAADSWKDPDIRARRIAGILANSERHSLFMKSLWRDSDYLAKMARRDEETSRRWSDPVFRREVVSKISQARVHNWRDENYRRIKIDQIREAANDPVNKARRSEVAKRMWEDEEYRRKMSLSVGLASKQRWEDEEYRSRMISSLRRAMGDPVARAAVSERNVALWKDDSFREKQMRTRSRPEYKAHISEKVKEAYRRPSVRAKHSEALKRAWADPVRRKARLEILAESYKDPVRIRKITDSLRQRPNKAEKAVSSVLKSLRLRFWFQKHLEGFWPDFVLKDFPIVIECDGFYWHSSPEVRLKDRRKRRVLRRAGYHFLTVESRQVSKNSTRFRSRLISMLSRLEKN